jgi:hypothetical protein
MTHDSTEQDTRHTLTHTPTLAGSRGLGCWVSVHVCRGRSGGQSSNWGPGMPCRRRWLLGKDPRPSSKNPDSRSTRTGHFPLVITLRWLRVRRGRRNGGQAGMRLSVGAMSCKSSACHCSRPACITKRPSHDGCVGIHMRLLRWHASKEDFFVWGRKRQRQMGRVVCDA